jgi:hypothetical protein
VPEEAALSHLVLKNHSSRSPAQPTAEGRVSCSDLSHDDGAPEAALKFKSHLLERGRQPTRTAGRRPFMARRSALASHSGLRYPPDCPKPLPTAAEGAVVQKTQLPLLRIRI